MPPPDMGFFPDDYGSHYGSDYGSHRGSAGMGHPDTMEFSKQGRSDYGWGSRNGESKFESQKSSSPTNCAGGSPAKSESGARLFVQNLPEFYEESHLKQLFSSYGEIKNTTIQRDRHGKSIQCGFVSFSQTEDANNALEALDGVMLSTQTLVIHVM
jgi:RNA recognition motif-containing protein